MPYDMRPIIARLRQAREEAGLSARQASFALGMTASAVNKLERMVVKLDVERLFQLCELYGADAGEILGITARGTRTITQDELDDLTAAQRHLTRALRNVKGK